MQLKTMSTCAHVLNLVIEGSAVPGGRLRNLSHHRSGGISQTNRSAQTERERCWTRQSLYKVAERSGNRRLRPTATGFIHVSLDMSSAVRAGLYDRRRIGGTPFHGRASE